MGDGGVFPAASPFSLLSSIFIEWPVRLQQSAGLTPCPANGSLPPSTVRHVPAPLTPVAPSPHHKKKKIEFSSLPTPPLLTQHYKVWQSIHSLTLTFYIFFPAESDKGKVAVAKGGGRWVGGLRVRRRRGGTSRVTFKLWLKRSMDNISRRRRSDLRRRDLRQSPSLHPSLFSPSPHPSPHP